MSSYYIDCIEKYKKLPVDFRNRFGNEDTVLRIKIIETSFDVDLRFIILLIAIGDLKIKDVSGYLQKEQGIDREVADEVRKQLNLLLFDLIVDELDNQSIKEIVNTKLALLLKLKEKSNFLQKLNQEIIVKLFEDDLNKTEFLNDLLANQEKLTAKEFISEGRKGEPTISNWLKDFISKNGSGIFDNLVLSKYITDSENAKKLDNNERNLLKKLLVLYRNLKFFPESLASDNGIGWQIIPVEEESDEVKKTPTSPRPSPFKGEGDKVSELRAMAEQFPVGSLERKAIEEDIKKLGAGS